MSLCLKKAVLEDRDLIFNWVNDKGVRKNSFNKNEIPYENHVVWFNNRVNLDSCVIFILYVDSIPIGQIRVDIEKSCGTIDYSIDKNYRGNGYGSKILNMLEKAIVDNHINIIMLTGKVKYDNIASQRAFEKNEYEKKLDEKCVLYSKKIKIN